MSSKLFLPLNIVSIISEMKWNYYAKRLYWKEFFILGLMIALFLVDIFWIHYESVEGITKTIAGNILNSFIAIILLKFIKSEIK